MSDTFTEQEQLVIKKLLIYSFKDIYYNYENLSDTEKSLISKDEFNAICDKLQH